MAGATPSAGDEIRTGTLFRRIPNDADHWFEAENRPASYNFIQDNDDEYLSTQWSELTTPGRIFAQHPGAGLLEVPVAVFWEHGLRVTYEPKDGPDHVAVWGLKNPKTSLLKKLRKAVTRTWRPGTSELVQDTSH